MVANVFYLTMQFYYFYVLATFVLAAPIVFGRRAAVSGPDGRPPAPRGSGRPART